MSDHYVMFGNYRITCSEEYMQAFRLVDGQSIDHVIVEGMNNMATDTVNQGLKTIANGIDHLRETRAELLAAAKAIYEAVHGDTVAVGPLWGRLHAAIVAMEKP